MTKLGSIDMKELPNDTIEDMSSSDEQESQKEISTPPSTVQRSEPVPLTPKQKRKMSEKQLEALKRGRAKKLEMNLKSREGKKKYPKKRKKKKNLHPSLRHLYMQLRRRKEKPRNRNFLYHLHLHHKTPKTPKIRRTKKSTKGTTVPRKAMWNERLENI